MRRSRKKIALTFMIAICLVMGTPAVVRADHDTVRLDNIPDLTPQQWSSSDDSEYYLAGGDNTSIHVPNFGPAGSNMEGDPIVIAVIDSAIDFTNPDLSPIAYTFTPEQQKALGCDEHGFNACIQSKDGLLTNPTYESHGTHCAGIIGAAWDGKGISGVASNVRLISVQNYAEDGLTSLINAMRAFDFIDRANEAGCGISLVSCSWNMLQANENLNAMIKYLGEKWGIVTIIAAGNEEADLSLSDPNIGALYNNPYAVIVGATDCAGNLAAYSSYGKQIVSLAAPGSGILSTVCTEESQCEYFADAVPESNKLYEGFEEKDARVKAELTRNGEEKLEILKRGTITNDSHFSGSHSLKIKLDPKNAVELEDSFCTYWITLRLGDLSQADVQPGDYLGFTFGGDGAFVITSVDYFNPVSKKYEELEPENYNTMSFSSSWVNCNVKLPELADPSDVAFSITVITDEDMESACLDAVGIGTQKVPYSLYNGTSMATPAVTGFAAVMKASHPDLSGAELADFIKASVRPMESLSDRLQSEGMLDFLVAESAGTSPNTFSPVIHQVEVAGKSVTIKGIHFGETGSVEISRFIAGKEPEAQNAAVEKWTDDCVTLSLDKEFDGILQAELHNSVGGMDTAVQFVNKRAQIYEEELPINLELGELFMFDANGDRETAGPLLALDGRLYYMPAITKVEKTPAHKELKCYDLTKKTWSDLPELPEWLAYVSAAVCKGKIYVKGSTMTMVDEDTAYYSTKPERRVYVFDPSNESWTAVSSEGVLEPDTLAGDNEQLFLVGSAYSEPTEDSDIAEDAETQESTLLPATVRPYDPDRGAGDPICELKEELLYPAVAVKDGVICTYDPYTGYVERVRDGKSELLEDAFSAFLPDIATNEEEYSWLPKRNGVLLPVSEGFLLVGPAARDGSGDSFLLRDEETVFTPFEKRMSDSKVFYPAAASDNGKIYAIGSTLFEPTQRFFRAATLDASESGADSNIPSETDTPANSQNSFPVLWIILIIVAAAVIVLFLVLFRQKKK